MKIELKDTIERGKLIHLIEANGTDNQYSKEMHQYLDILHNRIKNLELAMEVISDQAKRML